MEMAIFNNYEKIASRIHGQILSCTDKNDPDRTIREKLFTRLHELVIPDEIRAEYFKTVGKLTDRELNALHWKLIRRWGQYATSRLFAEAYKNGSFDDYKRGNANIAESQEKEIIQDDFHTSWAKTTNGQVLDRSITAKKKRKRKK